MDGCLLCTGGHDGDGAALNIAPVYDASAYRTLADSELRGRLSGVEVPDAPGPGEEAIYAKLADAEPPTTMEQMTELQVTARARAWRAAGPPFLDLIVWAHKPVRVAWLATRAAAKTATREGDADLAAEWHQAADLVLAAVLEGSTAALDYLQKEAGYVQLGPLWEDAHNWVTGAFPLTRKGLICRRLGRSRWAKKPGILWLMRG